jgi:hypothetical protein
LRHKALHKEIKLSPEAVDLFKTTPFGRNDKSPENLRRYIMTTLPREGGFSLASLQGEVVLGRKGEKKVCHRLS